MELGLTPKQFWKLSFYDWSLYALRIRTIQKRRDDEHDFQLMLERNWLMVYTNSVRDKKVQPFEPEDFYALSGDKVEKEKEKIPEEDFQKKVDEVFSKRKVRTNGRNSSSKTSNTDSR